MARVLFLMDFEHGHIFPAFGLARGLAARGHEIHLAGLADAEGLVRAAGFPFTPILEDVYPPGRIARMREEAGDKAEVLRPFDHIPSMTNGVRGGALDRLLTSPRPDLMIASFFVSLEALILHYRHGVPTAFLTHYLRPVQMTPQAQARGDYRRLGEATAREVLDLGRSRDRSVEGVPDLFRPLIEAPEIIPCPRELDLPGTDRGLDVVYAEPSIREDRTEAAPFAWESVPEGKKLVYVSLGSQTEIWQARGERLYGLLFEAARLSTGEGWHFILSLNRNFDAALGGPAPENVTVAPWLPQLEVLRRASAAVTHGGLGTIKECIFTGVPMVVLPLGRDQPANAARVQHHRLGLHLAPDKVTAAEIVEALRRVLSGGEATAGLGPMTAVFRARERARPSVDAVETLLAGRRLSGWKQRSLRSVRRAFVSVATRVRTRLSRWRGR
jgi:zeaxanthin glucosyltransferase